MKIFPWLIIFVLALGTTTLSPGQSAGLCRATGHAVVVKDPTKPEEELKEMAERTAWIVAMRNLGEQIEGVRVDARTTVHDYTVTSDKIRTKIKAMIQNARIVGTKYLKDGTVEVFVETDCDKILEIISSGK
jgi:outer membrane protein FlgP